MEHQGHYKGEMIINALGVKNNELLSQLTPSAAEIAMSLVLHCGAGIKQGCFNPEQKKQLPCLIHATQLWRTDFFWRVGGKVHFVYKKI